VSHPPEVAGARAWIAPRIVALGPATVASMIPTAKSFESQENGYTFGPS
jgi:hypothetical protein